MCMVEHLDVYLVTVHVPNRPVSQFYVPSCHLDIFKILKKTRNLQSLDTLALTIN